MILTTVDLLEVSDQQYADIVKAANACNAPVILRLRANQSAYAFPEHWRALADRIEAIDARGVVVAVLKDRNHNLTYDTRSPT